MSEGLLIGVSTSSQRPPKMPNEFKATPLIRPLKERATDTPEIDRIIKLPELTNITGLSKSSIYREIARGTFPKQKQLSRYSIGWRTSEIADWVTSRPTVSDAEGHS